MSVLRGISISFGIFFLVYVATSAAVVCCWQVVRRRRAMAGARFLYGMRVLPLFGSLALVALLVVPSFLYLEPYGAAETLRPAGLLMAIGGAAVIGLGVRNAFSAWLRTARCVALYAANSRRVEVGCRVPVLEIAREAPALLVAGIRRPALLVSRCAGVLLEAAEMRA